MLNVKSGLGGYADLEDLFAEGLLVGQGLEEHNAAHAPGNVPEDRFEGLGVLGSAVGAQIRLVHAQMMPLQGATWLAYCKA